ncbi:MAG: ATP-binding protein [Bdellovibrionales bacterium]|nr:ATP-binding protein [Bdellovibrionales bacterium]
MPEINWGFISDGKTFESLIFSILKFKDVNIRVYERPGPDASIDAKSEDGKVIYQAKYTQSEKLSEIITKAKEELKKIEKYKQKNHKNYTHWTGVEKWCLITNATWNPSDEEKWKNEVEKPFEEIGLEVELQHQAGIKKDLITFPHVKNEYFSGENRVLQSLPEFIAKIKKDKILSKGLHQELIGRQKELEQFLQFISSDEKKIISIHGPGGIGKTHFSIECAYQANQKEYDIYYANTATLERSNSWFQSIVTSRKALLIIDEPKEHASIEILLEQAHSSRLLNWKFVIITRTAKDHILEPLNPNRLQIVEKDIQIKPLNSKETRQLIERLIENSQTLNTLIPDNQKINLRKYLMKTSGGFPVWNMIAIHLLEQNKGKDIDFIKDEFGLQEKYWNETISSPPQSLEEKKFIKYIKAIAILQPIYVKDNPQLQEHLKTLINDSQLSELEDVSKLLQDKSFAVKRGRLLEITPDVIRDYIIIKKIGDNRQESKEWLQKVLQIKNLEVMKSALTQLAKLAHYQKHEQDTKETSFDEIWDIFSDRINQGDLNEQYNILKVASGISFSDPIKFLNLTREIKLNNKPNPSTKWTSKYANHENLILQLPWEIYKASGYIHDESEAEKFFKELIELAEKESTLIKGTYYYLANDGRRAIRLITELMKDSHPRNNIYIKIISEWIISQIENINNLNEPHIEVLKETTEEFLKIEIHDTHFEERHFIHTKTCISPKSLEQKIRNKILKKIWLILSSNPNQANVRSRIILWTLLQTYHSETNLHSDPHKRGDENYNFWEIKLKNHFTQLKEYISKKNIEISEIKSLRSIWDWHLKYDQRNYIKKLAQECETSIEEHNSYNEIISLFEHNWDHSELEHKVEEYISKHNLESQGKIKLFIDSCFKYDSKSFDYITRTIAQQLAGHKNLWGVALEYAEKEFKNKIVDHHFKFACEIALIHLINLKNDEEDSFSLTIKYWKQLINVEQKEYFLKSILYTPHFKATQHLIVVASI